MSPMGLYRYVDGREELESTLTERVLSSVDLEAPSSSWREQVSYLLNGIRAAAAAHPASVPILLAHRHAAPSSLRWIEEMLTVLRAAGFRSEMLVVAQRTLVDYLVGALQAQQLAALAGEGTATMEQLSPTRYPNVTEAAAIASRISPEEEFQRGLEVIVNGLEAQLDREQATSTT